MQAWISIVISLIGLLITLSGAGVVIEYRIKKNFKQEEENKQKIIEADNKKWHDDLTAIIKSELQPIKKELEEMHVDDDLTKKGIQALLRNKLDFLYKEAMVFRCEGDETKAYATHEEKIEFTNLYEKYHVLGKNGVMDSCYKKYMSLSESAPIKTMKKTKTKKENN